MEIIKRQPIIAGDQTFHVTPSAGRAVKVLNVNKAGDKAQVSYLQGMGEKRRPVWVPMEELV